MLEVERELSVDGKINVADYTYGEMRVSIRSDWSGEFDWISIKDHPESDIPPIVELSRLKKILAYHDLYFLNGLGLYSKHSTTHRIHAYKPSGGHS